MRQQLYKYKIMKKIKIKYSQTLQIQIPKKHRSVFHLQIIIILRNSDKIGIQKNHNFHL